MLEDDCLPHESFFRFCDELLERYADGGAGHACRREPAAAASAGSRASYHFSRYVHIWGWATWRRAWRHFDVELREWHELDRAEREARLRSMFAEESERRYWRYVWDNSGEIENWDAQWSYALLAREGLAATPNRNLISNIGFGSGRHQRDRGPVRDRGSPPGGDRASLSSIRLSIEPDDAADAAASLLFASRARPPAKPRLGHRAWAATLRAGGRALDFVPAPIRPRIRHRDREQRRSAG